jgi:hypothetical protein
MKYAICMIRSNDESMADIIFISAEYVEEEGIGGYRLKASNGDDVGYFAPRTLSECRTYAFLVWGQWNTYVRLGAVG